MKRLISAALIVLATPAMANDDPSQYGTTNPLELGIGRVMENIRNGVTDMTTCATGYYITKSGRHEMARELFEACAEQGGYTGAMTWMSQLDNNGLGAPYDPDASAEWDRRAADAGDPVGKFNYGIDLMRGHGVARDDARGRALVDAAADEGLPIAQVLRDADYDLDVVTPDADNWKYGPMF